MGVGQAPPLHGAGAEEPRLGRGQLVVAFVLVFILLLQVHLAAPERVDGEAGAAAADCG